MSHTCSNTSRLPENIAIAHILQAEHCGAGCWVAILLPIEIFGGYKRLPHVQYKSFISCVINDERQEAEVEAEEDGRGQGKFRDSLPAFVRLRLGKCRLLQFWD